ncbi:MAG: DUF5691 domain-containing protein [Ktedonobacterales bacterium]
MSLMDPMVQAALVGTRVKGTVDITTGTAIDSLPVPPGDKERALLLQAGARSIYAMAGYIPAEVAAPEAPLAEDLTICSPLVAELLKLLLDGTEDELQILAFRRMRDARLVLAPELLPKALDTRDKEKRRLLHPLLGRRGLWLSQFNPAWAWVGDLLDAQEGAVPDNARALWQEGTKGQRTEVLRRVREADPGLAREWILETWKHEKPELRAELLSVLKVSLGPDDEPFLEQSLDDRAGIVRAAAADALRGLTTSALSRRMLARADSLLTYSGGSLQASPPTAIDAGWQRDGIPARAGGTGSSAPKSERANWLLRVISCVPPRHWEERFYLTPEALIAAASQTKWESALLEGWTNAAVTYGQESWMTPLWSRWTRPADKSRKNEARPEFGRMYTLLAPHLPGALQEEIAKRLMSATSGEVGLVWHEVLSLVTAPWSMALAEEYLRGLQAFVAHLDAKSSNPDPWADTLTIAVTALPMECLSEAARPLKVPAENRNWRIQNFQTLLDNFLNNIQLRARIEQEIAK